MLFLIAGTYDGALDNSGERIRLKDATGEMVLDFSYDPAWLPPANDGGQRPVRRLGERLVEPVLFAEAEDQVGQEADDALDVVEVGGFHDRVHAAERQ